MANYKSALSLKPDWAEARDRLTAWWKRENTDRICLGIVVPDENAGPPPPLPKLTRADGEKFYLDPEVRLQEIEHNLWGKIWLGEAFPNASMDLGPGSLALYLGSPPGWHPRTVWYHPWPPAAEHEYPRYDEQNPIWIRHQQMLERLAEAGRGRFLPNIPDLIEALDTLASLRGNEELLVELYDSPEWVHECLRRLGDLYFIYYDRCYEICKDEDGGVSFTAFQVWAPGRMAKLQCDFSAMISAEMFGEFEAPYLASMCERLDYSVYHWDGPGAIQHLEHLVSIPRLDAIQWTPGAGNHEVFHEEWYPLYRRILDAGKGLLFLAPFDPDGIAKLVKTFGPRGIYIHTSTDSRKDAEELLARAERNFR